MGTDIHGVWQKKTDAGWEDIASTYEQDRHYLLFAWLGNVRNGFGFAGVPTHTPITPLSDCRGLPEDFLLNDEEAHPIASLEAMDPRRQGWHEADEPLEIRMGYHSFSWVSGAEVLAALENLPPITRTGIISVEEFKAWDGKSAPETWSGGISGLGVLVSHPTDITDKTSHVQIEWQSSVAESVKYFTDEVSRLADLHGEIRFVFGFDS